MATISWNEVRKRAVKFAHDWKDASSETAEAQTLWNEFFEIFGLHRKDVAHFEASVERLGSKHSGRIDLFIPGKLIAVQRSGTTAYLQAMEYGVALEPKEGTG